MLSSLEAFQTSEREHKEISPPPSRAEPLHAVIAQMREGFLAFDQELRIIEVNPAAELYLGLSPKAAHGHTLQDVLPDRLKSFAWEYYSLVLKTGDPVEFQVRSPNGDGARVDVRAFPYGDGVGLLFSNVFGLVEAMKYKSRVATTRAAIRADPSTAILRINLRGGLNSVDDSFCAMLGFSRDELLKLLFLEVVLPKDRIAVTRALNAVVNTGQTETLVVTLMSRGGQDRRCRVSLAAVGSSEEIREDVLAFILDLTTACEEDEFDGASKGVEGPPV